MRAIVLVGGEGTRLRPLTWQTPKALVPVLGRPLLDHLLLHLRAHGIDHVTLAMTQRNIAIRDAYADGARLGLAIDYAYEDTPLGSGGAIGAIARSWRDTGWVGETFAVVNGDVITDLDLSAMIEAHRARRAVLSISLHEVEDPSPFGVVALAADGRIERFVEKPPAHLAPSRLINAGTWLFEPELIDRLDPTAFNRVEDGLFPSLCADGAAVFGFHRPCYWADVGNPTALLRVNLDMAAHRIRPHNGRTGEAPPAVASSASIATDARVEDSVIGERCRIEPGAAVSGSLLWGHVTVGRDATVRGSTLATGVSVGAGATVEASVVAHGAIIEPGALVKDQHIEPAAGATATTTAAPRMP